MEDCSGLVSYGQRFVLPKKEVPRFESQTYHRPSVLPESSQHYAPGCTAADHQHGREYAGHDDARADGRSTDIRFQSGKPVLQFLHHFLHGHHRRQQCPCRAILGCTGPEQGTADILPGDSDGASFFGDLCSPDLAFPRTDHATLPSSSRASATCASRPSFLSSTAPA